MRVRVLVVMVALFGLSILVRNTACAYHLYHLDGSQVEQQVAESLVTVLFARSVVAVDSVAFARERPELNDDSPIRNLGRGIYIFAVEPGTNIATVMSQLRTDSRVRMINPVLGDGRGHVQYMGDQVIVRFKDGTPRAQIDSLNGVLASYVNPPDPDQPLLYFVQARSDLHVSTLEVADMYYHSGLCRYAQPNFIWQPVLDQPASSIPPPDSEPPPPPDTLYAFQWHWNNQQQAGGIADADIDADSAWMVTKGDSTVRVAILDWAFDVHHEDVDSLTRVFGYDRVGTRWDSLAPDWDPFPPFCSLYTSDCGHGTACLGELAAAHCNQKGLKGLAPHCTYWAIKMNDDADQATDSNLALALKCAWADFGCQVVSNSWGVIGPHVHIEAQCDTMYREGVSVFFAAGNNGVVDFPAYLSTVTAVGATDPSDAVWSYSGKGDSLDIVAPGGDATKTHQYGYIWTEDMMGTHGYVPFVYPAATCANDDNYYCKHGGTSSAAPIAAGIAALVFSRRPDFKDSTGRVELIRHILYSSAEHIPAGGFDTTYGHGRVNAYRALLAVIRGDFDNSGRIDSLDVFGMRDYCFKVGLPPTLDKRVADTDGDGDADICDYLRTLAAAGCPA